MIPDIFTVVFHLFPRLWIEQRNNIISVFPNGLDNFRGGQIPPIWDVVSIAIRADFAFRKINFWSIFVSLVLLEPVRHADFKLNVYASCGSEVYTWSIWVNKYRRFTMLLVLLEPVSRADFKCVCIVRVRSIYVIDMNKQIPPIHDVIGTVRTSKSFRFQMSI